jgi:hypothetical protein
VLKKLHDFHFSCYLPSVLLVQSGLIYDLYGNLKRRRLIKRVKRMGVREKGLRG